MALNFYEGKATLFQPKVNNLGVSNNGKAASEFPIVPWVVGNIWKVTGVQVGIYRLVNFLFLFFGLFFIYRLFHELSGSKLFSALISGLIFTSPNISYYGISMLSDIQAFGLCMGALFYLSRYIATFKIKWFLLFVILFLLAGLIKASYILLFGTSLIWLFIEIIKSSGRYKISGGSVITILISFFTVIFIWLAWIKHADSYNKENTQVFFLVGLLPIWDMTKDQILENTQRFFMNLLPQVFNVVFLGALLGWSIIYPIQKIKEKGITSLLPLIYLLTGIVFVLLFFGALDVHDYYLTVLVPVCIMAVYFIFKQNPVQWMCSKRFLITMFIAFALNNYLSSVKVWKKTNMNVISFEDEIVFNEFERKNYFWVYWHNRRLYQPLESGFVPEQFGINKEDAIICLGDPTINQSLFLMQRAGYTSFNCPLEYINQFIAERSFIKHLVLIDDTWKDAPELQMYLPDKVGEYESITVYRVNNSADNNQH